MEEKDKKPFKDTKFAEFFRNKVRPIAGDVLDFVGDVTGVEAIERLGKFLHDKQHKSEAWRQLAMEFEAKRMGFEVEILRASIESYRAEVDDRQGARGREGDFTKVTQKRDWLMASVVITGLVLVVGVTASMLFIEVPEGNQRLADMAFGAIMSIGASIFSYYVGSSRSSRHKDETIFTAIKNQITE
jgi:hypothetical protein